MRVQIKELRYWKTEHKDLDNCQDAYDLDPSKGLFVVADGAGTTLFPAIWARILAKHFVTIPLMSADPFEVEWWVRLAQDKYKTSIPDMAHLLDWSIRQKALSESSDSTLATVRVFARDASSAQAELLVFGDSCVIIGNTTTQKVESFVLENAAQFAQAPICIPSLLRFFNHYFHKCSIKNVTLRPEHIVILASDAVSKWIVGGGGGRYTGDTSAWEAFQTVCGLSEETWPDFIEGCRAAKEMVNDDCTALILALKADGAEEGVPLGETTGHDGTIIQERKAAFEKADQEQNNELVAVYYGDGNDIGSFFPEMKGKKIKHAQDVADALQEVLRAFRQAQNTPGLVAKMQPIWRHYGPILEKEKCAENIRETLRRNGVNLSLKEPEPPPGQAAPASIPSSEVPTIYPSSGQPISHSGPQTVAANRAEQEREALELRFLRAYSDSYSKNNDDVLLATAKALEMGWPNYPFKDAQKTQIHQAEERTQMLGKLHNALSTGLIEEIRTVYNPNLISADRLTPEEYQSVQLALLLAEAFGNNDDETILTLDQRIQTSGHRRFFSFTRQEQERIDLARRRKDALSTFQTILKTGNLREIANRYDPILDNSKELIESDREFLQLAREFAAAYDSDDDAAIIAVDEKIAQSSYRDHVALTRKEQQRIQEAKESMKAIQRASKMVVARVKGQDITLEQVRKVSIVRKAINLYWIDQCQKEVDGSIDAAARQNKLREIKNYQDYIDYRQIAGHSLEDLIHDTLIQEKMSDSTVQNAFLKEFKAQQELSARVSFFQYTMVPDYQAFLRVNRLSHDDVEGVFLMDVRTDFFKPYFEEQQKSIQPNILNPFQKGMQLDEWMRKQRKEVSYMADSNEEKRALWLAEQLGWKE